MTRPEPYAELAHAILGWKVRGDQETLQEFLAEYLGPRMEEAARQIAEMTDAASLTQRWMFQEYIDSIVAILRSTMGSK